MKLKDYLITLDPGQEIRIACKPGSNFIYIGKAGDLDLEKLSKRCLSDIEIRRKDMIDYINAHANDDRFKSTVDKYEKRLKKSYMNTPIEDRDILETYHGIIEPESICIRIPGLESFYAYNPELPPLTPETISNAGAQQLIGHVYIEAARELTACKRVIRKRNINKDYRNSMKAKMDALERFFRFDHYQQLQDPEAIIEQCRKNSHLKTLKTLRHHISSDLD